MVVVACAQNPKSFPGGRLHGLGNALECREIRRQVDVSIHLWPGLREPALCGRGAHFLRFAQTEQRLHGGFSHDSPLAV
jgi:hypothetical protein